MFGDEIEQDLRAYQIFRVSFVGPLEANVGRDSFCSIVRVVQQLR